MFTGRSRSKCYRFVLPVGCFGGNRRSQAVDSKVSAPQGFEPRYADPESAVLPLNEGASKCENATLNPDWHIPVRRAPPNGQLINHKGFPQRGQTRIFGLKARNLPGTPAGLRVGNGPAWHRSNCEIAPSNR